jgi:ABC-type multidrug transport system fused ATPase/permease subunit
LIDIYRKCFRLLDLEERRQFWFLTGLMVLMALFEIMGISAVLLLLNVLSDQPSTQTNQVLHFLNDAFNFSSEFQLKISLALVVLAVVLIGLVIKAGGTYFVLRFGQMRAYTVSSRLLEAYLNQPYAWFLERNSADIGKNVLNEVDGLVGRVLIPILRMIASVLTVLAIIILLMFVDPLVTLLSAGILGISYALIYLKLRESLRTSGEELMDAFGKRFRVAQEATGGIKEVKLLGLEDAYTLSYRSAARKTAKEAASLGVMYELPRFALEAITFGTMLTVTFVLLVRSGGEIASIVPTLGVFAFSVMRLLPALQQVYQGVASIRGAQVVLDTIITDLASMPALPDGGRSSTVTLRLNDKLHLSKIHFSYATADTPALRGADLVIRARTTIGIVGGTGAGKTTLVDLILGLLSPTQGSIQVDGTEINLENVRAWQKSLGYVPQAIFLIDDTIAANIAFGVEADQIDKAAVERAARTAALHEFVTTELAAGYQTIVGERGVRLSGGQRQRIGIARALYREPSLLIMDEATSALDNITERVVMEAVQNIRANKTIILIAHRLTTVRDCDCIFLMEHGRVVAQGTYDELIEDNESFQKLAAGV